MVVIVAPASRHLRGVPSLSPNRRFRKSRLNVHDDCRLSLEISSKQSKQLFSSETKPRITQIGSTFRLVSEMSHLLNKYL